MSSEISEEDIDISRGEKDVVFIHTEMDMEDVADREKPRQYLMNKMKKKGLKTENTRVIGIFQDEFSLLMEKNAKISLDGKQLYPEKDD